MNKTWKNILKISGGGQSELFDEKSEVSISSSLQVFSRIDFMDELNKLFVTKRSINMRDFYVHVIKLSGITYSISEYRDEIRALEKENYIKIKRENERTATGKLSHALGFEKENIFIERII